MEDIEVNTNRNNNFLNPITIIKKPTNNILFKPTFEKLEMEEELKINPQVNHTASILNRSSMMTYGKM